MAQLSGNDVALFLRESGSSDAFVAVVCNEDLSIESSMEVAERSTKCGVLKKPGSISSEIAYSGVSELSPSVGQGSEFQLANWFQNKTLLDFIVGTSATVVGDFNRTGQGYITAHTASMPVDDLVGFEGTFSVNGDVNVVA